MPHYEYDKDYPFAAFITNLGKYNEGSLVGEWVKFPTTAEELKKVFERIGIGAKDDFGQTYEDRAAELYLCRNWRRSGKLGDEKERLQVLTEQMKEDFIAAQNEKIDLRPVEKIMRDLDEQDHFTAKVLGGEQLLILSAGCAHQRFSALCRPYIYQDDSFSCDIYLFQWTVEDRSTSWGSILLHELGHVLNLRLTGDISVVPDDFLSFAERYFPGLSTKYRASAPEFFAHCFAMGVASRPGLECYDAFPDIQKEHKRLFDAYMRSKIARL